MILPKFSFQEEIPEGATFSNGFQHLFGVRIRTLNVFISKVQIFVYECVNKGLKLKWEVRDPAMEQYEQKIYFLLVLGI